MVNHLVKDKRLPVSKKSVYNVLNKNDEGKFVGNEWREFGRKRYLDEDKIKEISTEIKIKNGDSLTAKAIKEKIIDSKKESAEKWGIVPLIKLIFNPCPRTVSNYCAFLAHQSRLSLSKTVITKTFGRYTAENSLISAMVLLCVIAATHCFVVPEYDADMYRGYK